MIDIELEIIELKLIGFYRELKAHSEALYILLSTGYYGRQYLLNDKIAGPKGIAINILLKLIDELFQIKTFPHEPLANLKENDKQWLVSPYVTSLKHPSHLAVWVQVIFHNQAGAEITRSLVNQSNPIYNHFVAIEKAAELLFKLANLIEQEK
jgi:hypothetical protein